MPQHVLPEGTILDNHYRIDSLLGEGGFGITYAACNIRLDSKVAIKELFWRDHSARDVAESLIVSLRRKEDAEFFQKQKEHFLREARMLRDFSNRSEIARVLDYFEANSTAYIVMEYVEGQTLSDYVASRGPIPPQELFRRFLPLVETLSLVHRSGVIHRDISPDNIMVQPDGSLKLIDFGAAREYAVQKFSAIVTKLSFAPPEQHDQKGKLGPWTDVYALCATLYFCVTGQPPVDSVQRMFVDDLRAPSELRPGINPDCEAAILRGMELVAANRWQSMDALAEAMQKPLLGKIDPDDRLRRIFVDASAVLLCVAIALGIFLNRSDKGNDKENEKFLGIVTETFYLIPPGNQYVEDFARAQLDLKDSLDAFAGKDNYIVSPVGSELHVTLPLELFEERDIGEVLKEKLGDLIEAYNFSFTYQIQVNWDDPTASMYAGKNQIRSEDFTDETAIFSYEISEDNLSVGHRSILLIDFKTRLDALETPYAFGTAYGNPNEIIYRIDPSRIGRCVTETIGDSYPLAIAGEIDSTYQKLTLGFDGDKKLTVIDNGDGTFGLQCDVSEHYAEDIKRLTKKLMESGQDVLYLQTGSLSNALPLAQIDLQAPIENGVIEFQNFMFDGLEKIDAEHRYILDYFAALINDTDLPCFCQKRGEGIWDPENGGDLRFDESVDEHFSLFTVIKEGTARMRELLRRIDKETDYDCSYSDGTFWIQLHVSPDGHQIERIAEIVPELLKNYSFSDIICDSTVTIQLMDEYGSERYRIFLNSGYDSDSEKVYHYAEKVFSSISSDDPPPYAEEFDAWWDSFPIEDYGYDKGPHY